MFGSLYPKVSAYNTNYPNTHTNTGHQRADIIAVAQTQVGYYGPNDDNKYGAYFNHNGVSWCAYFVVWCARQAGIGADIIKTSGTASPKENYLNVPSRLRSSGYQPSPGDLIFFDWHRMENHDHHDHIGLVENFNSSTGTVTYIHGNTGSDYVARSTIQYNNADICCYGLPNYQGTTTPPTNLSISANSTSVGIGDTVAFTYSISGATAKAIGIDRNGSRYASLGVSNDAGEVTYTFNEPGVYCCIIEGYNSVGYNCSQGVYVTVIDTLPTNCSISANITSAGVGDTFTFNYSILGAKVKAIGIDRNGSRYTSLGVSNDTGEANYTFNEPGVYCCIIEGYNNVGYNCSHGVYITVVESKPIDCSISVSNTTVRIGKPVIFTYSITGATAKGIGIDRNGNRYASFGVSSDTGETSYSFSEPGTYCCIIEGYNALGYSCSHGVYVTVADYYSVKFNGNGATSGSMSNQAFTYDVAQNLTANAFKRAYTVTYNYNYSGSTNSTATATATFNGWATSADGAKVYNDKASVKNLATSGTYNLYANWTLGTVTLPTPTRTGYTFAGWNAKADGTGTKFAAGASYKPTAKVTLYAKWTANPPVITPVSGAAINSQTHQITGLTAGGTSAGFEQNYVSVSGGSFAYEYPTAKQVMGTGTKIKVYNIEQTLVDTYTVVIFGDVDGDGWYDGTDAYFVRLVANGLIARSALTDAQLAACDANHDGTIDTADVNLIEKAGLLLAQVDQTLPSEELQTNSVYLEYCSLIDQSVEITEPATDEPAQIAEPRFAAQSILARFSNLFQIILNWIYRIFNLQTA